MDAGESIYNADGWVNANSVRRFSQTSFIRSGHFNHEPSGPVILIMNHYPYISSNLLSPFVPDLSHHKYSLRPSSDTEISRSLHDSIKKFGIITPPLLQYVEDGYIIVSGRRRIKTARLLKLPDIPCSILPADIPLKEKSEYLLVHSRTGAELSVIERAVFFAKVVEELTLAEKISLLPYLGLKPQTYHIIEMRKYLALEEIAINGLHEGWIRPKTGLKLLQLQDRCDREAVVHLIKSFQFGGSKQQKLVNNAIELVRRTRQPFATLIKKWQHGCNDGANKPQQGAALLQMLKEKCSPRLAAAQDQFRQFQQGLQLPKNVTLKHTESFEDDTINLSISFEDNDKLLNTWKDIEKILHSQPVSMLEV